MRMQPEETALPMLSGSVVPWIRRAAWRKLGRRWLILVLLTLNTFCLAMAALAPTFAMLSLASLAIGITAVTAQIIIPAVSGLAAPAERWRVAGTLVRGLSARLLLARALSGFGRGKHVADDRLRRQRLRFQDAPAPGHCFE